MTTLYDRKVAAAQAIKTLVDKIGLVERPEYQDEVNRAVEAARPYYEALLSGQGNVEPIFKNSADAIANANMRHVRSAIDRLKSEGLSEFNAMLLEKLEREEEELSDQWHDAVHDATSEEELEALGGLRVITPEEAEDAELIFFVDDGEVLSAEAIEEVDGVYVLTCFDFGDSEYYEVELPDGVKLYTFVGSPDPVNLAALKVAA